MAIQLTDSQLAAVELIEKSKLALFTGKPGSGKTTTLSHWLRTIDTSSTFCFAPTGRAAQRMMEAFEECGVIMDARTIHSGLIPDRSGYDGEGWTFKYNRHNRLPCERVIVDEMSMADASTFRCLAEAIEPGTQVVLVGDPDQLPPVGKGRPFLDMIDSKVIPHANLTEVHRFAGRIAQVCQQVNQGKRITPSPEINLAKDASEIGPENFRHIERKLPTQQLRALDLVLDKVRDRGFDLMHDVQVLVCRNDKGPLNRKAVNLRLQHLLNPKGRQIDGCMYREGDKVMCLQNGMYTEMTKSGSFYKDGGSRYVANGEGGTVAYINDKFVVVKIGSGLVKFTKSMWTKQLTLAYAITTHKSQGGGWPVVIYLVDDSMLVDRNLLYTAFSRSKRLCFTIGEMSKMNRQIQKVNLDRRKTFLKEMLTHDGAIQAEPIYSPGRHSRTIRL